VEGGEQLSPKEETAPATPPAPPATSPLGSSHVSGAEQHLSSILGVYPWGPGLISVSGAEGSYSDTWHTAEGCYSDAWHASEGCYSDTWPAVTMAAPTGEASASGPWYLRKGGTWPFCRASCGTPPGHALSPVPPDTSVPPSASPSGSSGSLGSHWAHQPYCGTPQGHAQLDAACALGPFSAFSQGPLHPGLTPGLAHPGALPGGLAPAQCEPAAQLGCVHGRCTAGLPGREGGPRLPSPGRCPACADLAGRHVAGSHVAAVRGLHQQHQQQQQQQLLQMRLQAQAQGLSAVHSSSRLDVSGAPSVYPRGTLRPRGGRRKRGLGGGGREGEGGRGHGLSERQREGTGPSTSAAGDASPTPAPPSSSATSAPGKTMPSLSKGCSATLSHVSARLQEPRPRCTLSAGKDLASCQASCQDSCKASWQDSRQDSLQDSWQDSRQEGLPPQAAAPLLLSPLSEAFREQDSLECLLPAPQAPQGGQPPGAPRDRQPHGTPRTR